MIDTSKILVFVLTYNEEDNIRNVIVGIQKALPGVDVLIIDGGSTDKTVEIANELGAIVIYVSSELGIGGSVETGFLYADQGDYDYVIRLDGDDQHNAKDIDTLLQPVVEGKADMTIGGRVFGKDFYKASFFRTIGIRMFSFLVSKAIGKKIGDTTSGFYVANRKLFSFITRRASYDYSEVSSIILLHRAGFVVEEINVVMNERTQGDSCFTPLRAFFYVFNGLLSILVVCLTKVEVNKND